MLRTAVRPKSAQQNAPSETSTRSSGPRPLDPQDVDDIVWQFMTKHPNFNVVDAYAFCWPFAFMPKALRAEYLPTRMPMHALCASDSAEQMQRSAEVHMNIVAVLAGFAFSALASEGQGSSDSVVDQVLFVDLALAFLTLVGCLLHFMYVDIGLGTRGGAMYFRAYGGKIGVSCMTFHLATYLLAAALPLWAYRKFNDLLAPGVLASLIMALLWPVYDFVILLSGHTRFIGLLDSCALGVDPRSATTVSEWMRGCPPRFFGYMSKQAWTVRYEEALTKSC